MTRKENDFYPTPHSLLDATIERAHDRFGLIGEPVWEPCAGDGRLVDKLQALGSQVIYGDIVTGQDFFDYEEALAPTVFTNSPFKPIRQFIDHAFDIGVKRLILVVPERLWACGKGREQFERRRPSLFAQMDWREDYLGKGGSPNMMLAVSIWDRPHSKSCEYEIWGKIGDK